MKTITKYLVGFAVTTVVLTVIFRLCLSCSLANEEFVLANISGIIYFLAMFASGFFWGKKDGEYLPIYDVGFRFHCSTYLIFIAISELWFVLGINSALEKVDTIHYTAIFWGFIILIHFFIYIYCKRKSINGLNKDDLFE